jgi:hypothetical protein
MEYLKLFENFDSNFIGSFTEDQFDEFCDAVSKWGDKNGKYVQWDLYARPDSIHKDYVRKTWNRYIKGSVFVVIESGHKLIGTILKDGEVKSVFDDSNNSVNTSRFDPKFETI